MYQLNNINLIYIPSEDMFELAQEIILEDVVILKGFKFDGITAPPWLRWLIPRIDKVLYAAIVHDWMYKCAFKSKEYADKTFRDNLIKLGFSNFKSNMWYLGVKLFGKGNY